MFAPFSTPKGEGSDHEAVSLLVVLVCHWTDTIPGSGFKIILKENLRLGDGSCSMAFFSLAENGSSFVWEEVEIPNLVQFALPRKV